MNILVSNDDGIFREGIKVLSLALSKMGHKVYVFAPDSEQTAASMKVTARENLYVKEFPKEDYGAEVALSVSGTPVDCVRFGVYWMRSHGIEIDLACTGINHGYNLGGDQYFSGTMGAARQALLRGVPAIAFSLGSHSASHFGHFEWLIPEVVSKCAGNIPKDTFINVNVPDIPEDEVKGIKVCPVGVNFQQESFEEVNPGEFKRHITEYLASPDGSVQNADVDLGTSGWITISPVALSKTSEENLKICEAYGFQFK